MEPQINKDMLIPSRGDDHLAHQAFVRKLVVSFSNLQPWNLCFISQAAWGNLGPYAVHNQGQLYDLYTIQLVMRQCSRITAECVRLVVPISTLVQAGIVYLLRFRTGYLSSDQISSNGLVAGYLELRRARYE
jgi:hypothetical protein